jgi:hypothetical protein
MPENNTSQATDSSAEKKDARPSRARAFDGYQPTWSLDKSKPPRGRSGVPSTASTTSVKKTTGN